MKPPPSLEDIRDSLLRAFRDSKASKKLIAQVAAFCGVENAQLLVTHKAGFLMRSVTTIPPKAHFSRLAEHYMARNPRVLALQNMTIGKAVRDPDFISVKEIEANEVYQKLIIPRGHRHYCGVISARVGSLSAGFAFYAPEDHGPFSEATVKRLEAVADACHPFLDVALQISVNDARETVQKASLLGAIAAIDRRGRVLEYNDSFRKLIQRGAIALDPARRPILGDEDAEQMLANALNHQFDARARHFLAGMGEARNSLMGTLVPISGGHVLGIDDGYFLMVLTRLDGDRSMNIPIVQKYYGLTDAESDVATRLCEGDDIATISKARGTAPSTTRTLVKRLLAKTGTQRQAELVATLSRFFFRTAG